MICFCDVYRDYLSYVYLSEKAQGIFDAEIGVHQKGNYGTCKKVFAHYELSTAFLQEDFSGLRMDVPEGWIIIDELGCVNGAGGKYEVFLAWDYDMDLLNKMLFEDKKKIRSRVFDVVYSNEPLYEGEQQADRLSMYEMERIYEAIMNGPERMKSLTLNPIEDLIKLRDELIRAATRYCIRRMGISINQLQEKEDDDETLISFMMLFVEYWKYKDIKTMAEPWVEDLVAVLNSRQVGDLACYIAYQQAMSAR